MIELSLQGGKVMGEGNIMFDHNTVYLALKNIFVQRFNIDMEQQEGILLDKHLLGMDIGLEARDLIYLYFDIEKEFDITLPDEDIAEGKFTTFNNIAEIIYNQLQKKDKEAV